VKRNQFLEMRKTRKSVKITSNYTSRNKPASLRHFTLVVLGNKSLNSSQCRIEARPPAEQPERRA
jgi:hypothetical protein